MEHIILYFIATSLFIYGVHATTRDGMIFEFVPIAIINAIGPRFEAVIPYVLKPLCDCTPCMATIYGTASFFITGGADNLLLWPVWVFCLAGFNYLISKNLSRLFKYLISKFVK